MKYEIENAKRMARDLRSSTYRTSTLIYLPEADGAGTIGVNLARSRSVSEGKSLARFLT